MDENDGPTPSRYEEAKRTPVRTPVKTPVKTPVATPRKTPRDLAPQKDTKNKFSILNLTSMTFNKFTGGMKNKLVEEKQNEDEKRKREAEAQRERELEDFKRSSGNANKFVIMP